MSNYRSNGAVALRFNSKGKADHGELSFYVTSGSICPIMYCVMSNEAILYGGYFYPVMGLQIGVGLGYESIQTT